MQTVELEKPVHCCCYSSHSSLQILCDQSWTEPMWGTDEDKYTGIDGVYLADDSRLYTFDEHLVTCKDCLNYYPNSGNK